jgi:hypothetical protein
MSDLLHKQNNNMFHYSNYFLSIINTFINKFAGAKAAKAGDKKGAAPAEGGDEFRVSLIDEGRYSSAGGKPLTGNTKKRARQLYEYTFFFLFFSLFVCLFHSFLYLFLMFVFIGAICFDFRFFFS